MELTLNDIFTIIAIGIAFLGLLIALTDLYLHLRKKTPNIHFIKPKGSFTLTPSYNNRKFETLIPLIFVNKGSGDGTVIITECWANSDVIGENITRPTLLRGQNELLTKEIKLNPYSQETAFIKIGPIDIRLENMGEFEEREFLCELFITISKTVLSKRKFTRLKFIKNLNLVKETLDEIGVNLVVLGIDYVKVQEARKAKSAMF